MFLEGVQYNILVRRVLVLSEAATAPAAQNMSSVSE